MTFETDVDVSYPTSNFSSYGQRLKSFASWEGKIDKCKLAATGFYYTGVSDIVVCCGCNLALKSWERDDNPIIEHMKFKKDCADLPKRGFFPGNAYRMQQGIKYPLYVGLASRVKSFEKHPTLSESLKNDFAAAGFFYCGQNDWIFCYNCGVGLKKLDIKENPWILHTIYSLYCTHVEGRVDKNEMNKYWSTLTNTKNITREELVEFENRADLS